MTLTPSYRHGTHRLIPPTETLARLQPHLADFGITRCADVSALDADLGLPVYMAIRPRGRVFQSSAGKGLSVAAAKVSALMEAVELDVAERFELARSRRASQAELLAEGHRVDVLPEWVASSRRFFGDRFLIDWIPAEDLLHGGTVWLPASAAYFCEPAPCRTNTNGLASGNHFMEATLHGLYEVIERDAVARLEQDGRLHITRDCQVIEPASVQDPTLAGVVAAIARSTSKLVLLRVLSGLPIPTFWALLLETEPFASTSSLTAGFGTHLDPTVAMARAISEAVQSRLTMIHGSRDDIVTKPVYAGQSAGDTLVRDSQAYRFFDALEPSAQADNETYNGDLSTALQTVLSHLRNARHERVYRADLGCPTKEFSVAKVMAPTLRFNSALF